MSFLLSTFLLLSQSTIDGEAAMVTLRVRPERAASFDAVLVKLQHALSGSKDPQRRALAQGWQVFKSPDTVQGSVTYLMRLDPVVRGADYDIARIIAAELPAEAGAVAAEVKAAIISQSTLPLTRVPVPGLGESLAGPAESAPPEVRLPILSFDDAQAALITIVVRPEFEADFRTTLEHLGKALQASRTPARRRQAGGWRVFKGTRAYGENLVYVMSIDPVVPRAEYELIRLIQEAFPGEVDAIFTRYRQAFFGQTVSRLTNRVQMWKP